jgi:hypothetical protein
MLLWQSSDLSAILSAKTRTIRLAGNAPDRCQAGLTAREAEVLALAASAGKLVALSDGIA